MSAPLITPSFLFRFATLIRQRKTVWPVNSKTFDSRCELPSFQQVNQRSAPIRVFAGWSDAGLVFRFDVREKQRPPISHPKRLESSDSISLWIDTRNTQSIHRASRYCHRFLFLPAGGGLRTEEAHGCMLRIHRAKDDPRTFSAKYLPAKCQVRDDGYTLDAFVPAEFLFGYDVREYDKIGFFYVVTDHELGKIPWFHTNDFPVEEDPSMWGTLELAESNA